MSGFEQTAIATLGVLLGACIGAAATFTGVAKEAKLQKDRELSADKEEVVASLISLKGYITRLSYWLTYSRVRFLYHRAAVQLRITQGEVLGSPGIQAETNEVNVWRDTVHSEQGVIVKCERELDETLIRIKRIFSFSDEIVRMCDSILEENVPQYQGTGIVADFSLSNDELEPLLVQECDTFSDDIYEGWHARIDRLVELLTLQSNENYPEAEHEVQSQELMVVTLSRFLIKLAAKIWRGEV